MTFAAQRSSSTLDSSGGASFSQQKPSLSAGEARKAPVVQVVDYTTLVALAADLQQSWVPAKVEQAIMADKTTLCLKLRTPDANSWLHLCWHPQAARLTLGPPPSRGDAAQGYSFGEQMQGGLGGLVLQAVLMPAPWERVVELRFGQRPGEQPTRRLYCEVMARYSNVVLTDGEGTVLAAAHQVGGMQSSLRQVQVGRQYSLPPAATGVPPNSVSSLQEWRDMATRAAELAAVQQAQARAAKAAKAAAKAAAGGKQQANTTTTGSAAPHQGQQQPQYQNQLVLVDGFTRAFQGVSPQLMEELCEAAGVDPQADPTTLSDQAWAQLHQQWQRWLAALESRAFTPVLQQAGGSATGRYSVLGGLSGWSEDSATADSASGSSSDGDDEHPSYAGLPPLHAMLQRYYASVSAQQSGASLGQRLSSALTAALKKARGKVRALQSQAGDASKADALQATADLITANLYRIKQGDEQVEVEDWNDVDAEGQPAKIVLQLDATVPPKDQAAELYKKARKARRGIAALAPLLESASQELTYLEEVEEALKQLLHANNQTQSQQQQQQQQLGNAAAGDDDEASADARALKEVEEELIQGGYLKPPPDAHHAAKQAAKAAKAAARGGGGRGGKNNGKQQQRAGSNTPPIPGLDGPGFRKFTSPGGLTVLVGRNNKQNDVLSHQVAAPDDVWMHVRGVPGSHVVLRLPAGSSWSDADMQYAADLAAYYSKARAQGKADVIVCRAAALKKPKGARPGQVLVTKEMFNWVARPEQSEAAKRDALTAAETGGGQQDSSSSSNEW